MIKQLVDKYSSLFLMAMMIGVGGINYLFQIVIGRTLTIEEYGTVNSLLSLTSIISVPGTILAMIISKQISIALAKGNTSAVKSLTRIFIITTCLIGLGLVLIEICLSGWIGRYLHVNETGYVVICCVISGLTITLQSFAGTIQGMQKFFEYGFQSFITAICKIGFSVLLIISGFKVGGPLWGMLIAQVATLCYCMLVLQRAFSGENYIPVDIKQTLWDCSRDLWVIALGQLNISILTNCDLILVKRFFDETDAGIYSAAIIIARLVMYVSTMLIYVLFPKVANQTAQGKDTQKLFLKSLVANLVIIAAGCAGIALLGKWIIQLFLGNAYLQSYDMIKIALVYIVPVSVFTIITNYVSATDKVCFFTVSSTVGTVLVLTAACVFHATIMQMLLIMGFILAMVCMVNIIHILVRK